MSQTLRVQFFDPVEAHVINERFQNVRQRGFYVGAYLKSIPSDSSIIINPFVCEIGDSNYQVQITETADTTITGISATNNFIVLRWSYVASPSNVGVFMAVPYASVLPNDLIVGRAIYSNTILTGLNYAQRTRPDTLDLHLKVEQTNPVSMSVLVRGGRVNYGVTDYDIADQVIALTAPVSTYRMDVIYVDTDGGIKVLAGAVSGSPTPPNYIGKKAIAEITLTAGMSDITQGDTPFYLADGITFRKVIRDVRCFIGGGVGNFLHLNDVPSTYVGQAGKVVRVNVAETGLEFGAAKYQ